MISILALILAASIHAAPSPAPTPDAEPLPLDGMQAFLPIVLAANDFDTAEKVANDGIRWYPAAAGWHITLGRVYQSRGRYAEAFYELQWEILQAGPGSETGEAAAAACAELLETRAGERREVMAVLAALEQIEQDPAKAIEGIETVEKTRGKRLALEIYRAEALRNAGRREESAAAYRGVIDHTPSFVPAYVELARLDRKQSGPLLEKARAIDPRSWSLRAAK